MTSGGVLTADCQFNQICFSRRKEVPQQLFRQLVEKRSHALLSSVKIGKFITAKSFTQETRRLSTFRPFENKPLHHADGVYGNLTLANSEPPTDNNAKQSYPQG